MVKSPILLVGNGIWPWTGFNWEIWKVGCAWQLAGRSKPDNSLEPQV